MSNRTRDTTRGDIMQTSNPAVFGAALALVLAIAALTGALEARHVITRWRRTVPYLRSAQFTEHLTGRRAAAARGDLNPATLAEHLEAALLGIRGAEARYVCSSAFNATYLALDDHRRWPYRTPTVEHQKALFNAADAVIDATAVFRHPGAAPTPQQWAQINTALDGARATCAALPTSRRPAVMGACTGRAPAPVHLEHPASST